jgi:hypothetical protein
MSYNQRMLRGIHGWFASIALVVSTGAVAPSVLAEPSGRPTRPVHATMTSMVSARFVPLSSDTGITEFKVVNVPVGATLLMTCSGERCPFARRILTHRGPSSSVDLARDLDRRALKPGTVLELRISKPGWTGRLFRWQMQSGKRPSSTVLCLPPGGTKPTACP